MKFFLEDREMAAAGGTEGKLNYSIEPLDMWSAVAIRTFARFIHFGPNVLNRYSVKLLVERGLAVEHGSEIKPVDQAVAMWQAWIEQRRLAASAAFSATEGAVANKTTE